MNERRRTADRVFRGALIFNVALTIFWIATLTTGRSYFFAGYAVTKEAIVRVLFGVLMFNVVWGFIWWGVKWLLLRYFVGFTNEECRQAFSSRMRQPFEVSALIARYSERRIRIADMIGRRGRFITLGAAGFYYLYTTIAANPGANFATIVLQDNLFDAVIASWIFLAFFYSDSLPAAAFYGPQSRVMDGVLARANCLLITSLWTLFKFVMVPIGAGLARTFEPREFAIVFAFIWGSYMVGDTFAEVGGSLYGKQTLRVWGLGDINRKSIGGTVTGFAAVLVFCAGIALAWNLPLPWMGLAVAIAIATTTLELFSPRGTDDFTMATANALICWAFGALLR